MTIGFYYNDIDACTGSRPECGFGVSDSALLCVAVWHVCEIARSFVSGWRAFSSVSLCKSIDACIHMCSQAKNNEDGNQHTHDFKTCHVRAHIYETQ
jgi:hypothetical protein